ncbi:ATP-binding protein [bacterium]|nr:ATP-binding protein [bacterium]
MVAEKEIKVSSDPKFLGEVIETIEVFLSGQGIKGSIQDDITISVSEIVTNAMVHGNGLDPSKKVSIRISVNQVKVNVLIRDEGAGFDPGRIPDPSAQENLMKTCGRGIYIVKALMDEVECDSNAQGTGVRLLKYL